MNNTTIRIPAAQSRGYFLFYGAGFTALSCVALTMLFTTGFFNAPFFAWLFMLPVLCPILLVFGLFLLLGIGMLLYCVESIELSAGEIRLMVGPITLKKVPAAEIVTVGYTEVRYGRGTNSFVPMLMLSQLPAEQLIGRGEVALRKNYAVKRLYADSPMSHQQKCICAYFQQMPLPLFMMGFGKNIALGYSSAQLAAVRPYILKATYFIE